MENETRNGMTFEAWLEKIDAILTDKVGLGRLDFADRDYWNGWDGGSSPEEFIQDEWADPRDIEAFMNAELMF